MTHNTIQSQDTHKHNLEDTEYKNKFVIGCLTQKDIDNEIKDYAERVALIHIEKEYKAYKEGIVQGFDNGYAMGKDEGFKEWEDE